MTKSIFALFALLNSLVCYSQVFTSSNLPVIIINTNGQAIVDDPKITASLGIINNGPGQTNAVTDLKNEYDGKMGIEIRGQSTQMFPMKSYSIELRKNDGSSTKKPLFGLPAESDWVLYAPYNEKTLMHNFLAYTLSRQMGHWAANCRYVELVLNGEYKGIYVFMERIKRDDGRVKIGKLNPTDVSGEAVTGGYIFSLDKQADGWYSSFPAGTSLPQYTFVYPKLSNIVPEQVAYLKGYVDSFETALASQNYQDKNLGWRKFADEESFIDYSILNEVSRNVDGYRLSSYFNKDRNGKIKAGPAWDYDLAFRNADYCDGSRVDGWAWAFNNVCPSDYFQVPFWWNQFYKDTSFQSKLLCRWKELRQTTLSEQYIFKLIDSVSALTNEARQRHFTKWPVLGQYVWPNPSPIATTYEGEISTLKSWLTQRMQWIDNNLPNRGGCAVVTPPGPQSFAVTAYQNPLPNNAVIVVQSPQAQLLRLQIFGITGRQLLTQQYQLARGDNNIAVNNAGWPRGIYQFVFTAEDGSRVNKRLMK